MKNKRSHRPHSRTGDEATECACHYESGETQSPTLKEGMQVRVYLDPVTKQKREGEAVLVFKEQVSDQKNLQCWSVRFDHESGYWRRWIDPCDVLATGEFL